MVFRQKIWVLAIALLFVPLFFSSVFAAAKTCQDVAPDYKISSEKSKKCEDVYEECVADPWLHQAVSCAGECATLGKQKGVHVSYLTCVEPDYVQAITQEINKNWDGDQAAIDASIAYCQCIRQCDDQIKVPKDLDKDCEKPFVNCCENAGVYLGSSSVEDNDNPDSTLVEGVEDPDPAGNYVLIESVTSDVEIFADIAEETGRKAKIGDKVVQDHWIITGYKSEVRLNVYANGSWIGSLVVPEKTNLNIANMANTRDLAQVVIKLAVGKITATVAPEEGLKAKFSISTPVCTIGSRGTVFTVMHDEDWFTTTAIAHEHTIYLEDDYTGETYDIPEGNYAVSNGMDEPVVQTAPAELRLQEDVSESGDEPVEKSVAVENSSSELATSEQEFQNESPQAPLLGLDLETSYLIYGGLAFFLFVFTAIKCQKNKRDEKNFQLILFKILRIVKKGKHRFSPFP